MSSSFHDEEDRPLDPVYCRRCGRLSDLRLVATGIGAYEYAGFRGYDEDQQWLTACCEATWTPADPDELTGADADAPLPVRHPAVSHQASA